MTRDGPPCIRHLPFAVAGDWHRLPLRVLAPQRVCAGVLVPKLGAGARPDHPLSDTIGGLLAQADRRRLEFTFKNPGRPAETVATDETGSSSRSLPMEKIENLGGHSSQTCSAERYQDWSNEGTRLLIRAPLSIQDCEKIERYRVFFDLQQYSRIVRQVGSVELSARHPKEL